MSSTIAREGLWSDVIRLAIVSQSLQIVRVQPVVLGSSSTTDNKVGRGGRGGRGEGENERGKRTCFHKYSNAASRIVPANHFHKMRSAKEICRKFLFSHNVYASVPHL